MRKHGLDFCLDAELTIVHSDRKTIAIQLSPKGITLRAPVAMTDREAIDFLRKKPRISPGLKTSGMRILTITTADTIITTTPDIML